MQILIILVMVLLCLIRPFIPLQKASLVGTYEAFAHIFVGGIIGAYLAGGGLWLLYLAIGGSIVEVVCVSIGVIKSHK